MGSQIDLIAIISPRAGKVDRVIELLKEVSEYVEAQELGTTRYQITKGVSKESGVEEVIVLESYKDKAALGAHGSSKQFRAFQQKIQEEGLLAGPMQLKFVQSAGGFSSRL